MPTKKGKRPALVAESPAWLKWAKKESEKYNLPPDPPLEPHLGKARQGKADELRSEGKIATDIKRLASQGVKADPALLRKAAERAAQTKVEVTEFLPLGVRGRYSQNRKSGAQRIQVNSRVKNPRKDKGESSKDFQGKRTLRHEMEHAYGDSAGLAKLQSPLLNKLGAHSDGGHKGHEHSKESEFLKDEKLFDAGHMRIGVMHMRDDVGKVFLDGADLKNILGMDKKRKARVYLERMMKANPGMSLSELSKLTNQVARKKAAGPLMAKAAKARVRNKDA
tara:strand:- start:480 stop:1316 length:837 start_codon:yes stop_codon:yes gene_type:complete